MAKISKVIVHQPTEENIYEFEKRAARVYCKSPH